jgi:hypothetical protein
LFLFCLRRTPSSYSLKSQRTCIRQHRPPAPLPGSEVSLSVFLSGFLVCAGWWP